MLSAADEKWIEEFVTQVGKGGLVRLLTGDAEPTVQRCALACLHALASTKTGLHAIIADANVAEGVLIMLFLKPQFQVAACGDCAHLYHSWISCVECENERDE